MEFQHNHKFEKSIVYIFPKVGKLLEKQYNKLRQMKYSNGKLLGGTLQDKIWKIIVLVVMPH